MVKSLQPGVTGNGWARIGWRGGVFLAVLLLVGLVLGGCAKSKEDYASEGTAVAPVDLGNLSSVPVTRPGSVGADGSYYVVAVDSTKAYDVTLTDLSADADLIVYKTLWNATGVICASVNPDNTSENCTAIPAGQGGYFIRIKMCGDAGTDYTLTISESQ